MDGIKSGGATPSSRLSAGRVSQDQSQTAERTEKQKSSPLNPLDEGIKNNQAASVALNNVAREVASANAASKEARVRDVNEASKLADKISFEIKEPENLESALAATGPLEEETVSERTRDE